MKENAFLKKYLGGKEEAALDKEAAEISKLHPKLPFEEVIHRYCLWQISGVNVMQADQVKTGGINIVDKHQPWNVICEWGLGYFDGGCVRQMYNWSQTNDINYLKAAQHYLSKMLEEETRKRTVDAIVTPPTPTPPIESPEVQQDIDDMAKRLTLGPGIHGSGK